VFNLPNQYTLTDVRRQESDNPLTEVIAHVREHIDSYRVCPIRRETKVCANGTRGIWWTKPETIIRDAIRRFTSQEYRDDSDFVKVLAWRNEQVDYYNSCIRAGVYGEMTAAAKPFIEEEHLVAKSPILQGRNMLYPGSEELKILSVNVGTAEGFQCWYLDVESVDTGLCHTIQVIHERSKGDYLAALEEEKMNALHRSGSWIPYYTLKNAFANVTYAFATTVHKSQGSTYQNALIDVTDILRNTIVIPEVGLPEVNRCLYTAFTRASEKVIAC
jgi:ATP-dependent exoDNAse (exonuclease V) alpha subunit